MVDKTDIQNARRQLGKDRMPAVLGNGSGQPRTAEGLYWVRKQEAGGYADAIKLPLAAGVSIKVDDGTPCSIGWDEDLNQVIYPRGGQALAIAGINPLILNPLDATIQKPAKTADFPPFVCKRHGDTVNFPLTVVVYVPPVVKSDDSVVLPNILQADLSSHVPAADLRCFAVVFWLDDNTLEVQSSTPISLLDPLTNADLEECIAAATTDAIPLWAWILQDDQSELSPDPAKNMDIRQFINTGSLSGSGGMTSFDVAADTGTPATITDGATLTLTGTGGITVDIDDATDTATIDGSGIQAPWRTDSNVVNLVNDGDVVTVGSATPLGKLGIDGDADEPQLVVQGNATQTNPLILAENSAGSDQFAVSNTGDITQAGFTDLAEISTPSTPASDHARTWVADDQGFSVEKFIDSGGQIFYDGRDLWIICRNVTGSTITKNTWFTINNASNGYPSVALADANNVSTNSQNQLAVGVSMDGAVNNAYFRLMLSGVLTGIDTSGFSAGAALWLSTTAGSVSNSLPTAGTGWAQYVGRVLVSNATTGAIQVEPRPPYYSQVFVSEMAIGQGSGAAGIAHHVTGGKYTVNAPGTVGADRTATYPDESGNVVLDAATQSLSNKKLVDSSVTFVDNGDNTKQLAFQLSGNTTGTTRTLTPPNFDGTIATLAGTETFTNKSISASQINSGVLDEARLPHKFAVIEEQQAQNTAGGGSTATTWSTRVLNTEVVDADNIVTLSSNKFTPISGTYRIAVNSPFVINTQSSIRLRLRNVTATSVVFVSNNNFQIANGGANVTFVTEFTANGTDEYDIQYYITVARATNGLGIAINETSAVERYTQVLLEKIA